MSLPAWGAGTAGIATASASAITLRKLSILNLSPLDFATIIATPAAGTITIDPDDDSRSSTGGSMGAGGVPQAAKFYTYGGPLQNLQVNRGPLPVLTRVGGGATMNVTGLTLNGPVLRFLDAAGLLDLRVGGTLAVGANQATGTYTGTFQIIVTYY
ncbi:DUF4402 domain-containing protein [Sphingomonas sp.]|uniref:DUF4402 domain-containing protein n=1 Tax=Sphingomonas sp. TaxID=28214 RepID=UPI0025EEBDB9|nr:DUF4402 domain-containing protein [Sphingomonas sp.]